MTIKRCRNCGKEIPKDKTVSNARHAKRKYCSQKCYRTWMRTNKEGWWRGTDLKHKHFDNPDDRNAVAALEEFNYI